MDPPIYITNQIINNAWLDFLIPLLASILGAGISALISWKIFKDTSNIQLDRDKQLRREEEATKARAITLTLHKIINNMGNIHIHLQETLIIANDNKRLFIPWWMKMKPLINFDDEQMFLDFSAYSIFKGNDVIHLVDDISLIMLRSNANSSSFSYVNKEIINLREKLKPYGKVNENDGSVESIVPANVSNEVHIKSLEIDELVGQVYKNIKDDIISACIALEKSSNYFQSSLKGTGLIDFDLSKIIIYQDYKNNNPE